MDALLMCGGRGSRLGEDEKPLRSVGGRPMVDRVRSALAASGVETVYAVTGPEAPETAARTDGPTIETDSEGYVADLQTALADERLAAPVVTVAADLPLLSARTVDAVLAAHETGPLTVAVPTGRIEALGFSADTSVRHRGVPVRPSGVNVVAAGEESTLVRRDLGLAANVNRPGDLARARWFCPGDCQFR